MWDNTFDLKIFEWIDKNIVKKILVCCKRKNYLAWDVVIFQGEESNWEWYIIKNWEVEVIIDNEVVATLMPWDIFWEIALLNEEQRVASVKAKTDIDVIVLNQNDILKLVANWNESINKDIMKRIEENLKNY